MSANPDWFAFVREGDVLRERSGAYRVVRAVTRWTRVRRGVIERGIGPLRSVTLVIRHRSWTNRCYTVLDAAALKTRGLQYVGARIKLASEIDAKIVAAIGAGRPYILTADDVRGIA